MPDSPHRLAVEALNSFRTRDHRQNRRLGGRWTIERPKALRSLEKTENVPPSQLERGPVGAGGEARGDEVACKPDPVAAQALDVGLISFTGSLAKLRFEAPSAARTR